MSNEERSAQPTTVDLPQAVVNEGVNRGILVVVRHTAQGEPVYGFTAAGLAALIALLANSEANRADE